MNSPTPSSAGFFPKPTFVALLMQPMPSLILCFTCVLSSTASCPAFVAIANVANYFSCPWFLGRIFVSLAFLVLGFHEGILSGSRRYAAGTTTTTLLCTGMATAFLQRAAIEFKQEVRLPFVLQLLHIAVLIPCN